jgi:hypothetical protein
MVCVDVEGNVPVGPSLCGRRQRRYVLHGRMGGHAHAFVAAGTEDARVRLSHDSRPFTAYIRGCTHWTCQGRRATRVYSTAIQGQALLTSLGHLFGFDSGPGVDMAPGVGSRGHDAARSRGNGV